MNRATQTITPQPTEPFPSLPADMRRNDWLDLIDETAKVIGVGSAARQTLRFMANSTRPRDWTAENSEPICYMAQSKLSERTGVSIPRIRAHQVELEQAGLIARKTGANGARSGHMGCGIYFSPGIALTLKLCAIRERLRAEAEKAALLRGQRSIHKGILRSFLDALTQAGAPTEAIKTFTEAFNDLPRADALHSMRIDALEAHVDNIRKLCTEADKLLDDYLDSHGQPLENERSYIQDTTQDSYVNCNAGVDQMRGGEPPQDIYDNGRPDGRPDYEDKYEAASITHKSEFIEKLSAARLYHLASEEMQLWFDVARQDRPIERLRLSDLITAACHRIPELGINSSAWEEAVGAMGPEMAALCVMIIDKNRNAPVPIRKPGGYLRGMTRRFQSGQLNIIGSLIGLNERLRTEGV